MPVREQDRDALVLTASSDDHFGVCDEIQVVTGLPRWQRVPWPRAAMDRLKGRRVHPGPSAPFVEPAGCVVGGHPQNPRAFGIGRHPPPAQDSGNLIKLPLKFPGAARLGAHPRRVANAADQG